jgi:hypothetical protein
MSSEEAVNKMSEWRGSEKTEQAEKLGIKPRETRKTWCDVEKDS